jgi:hypothetical protein
MRGYTSPNITLYTHNKTLTLNLSQFCDCSSFAKIINGTIQNFPLTAWTEEIILIGKLTKMDASGIVEISAEKAFNEKIMKDKYIACCHEDKKLVGKNVKAIIARKTKVKVGNNYYPRLIFLKVLDAKEYDELLRLT